MSRKNEICCFKYAWYIFQIKMEEEDGGAWWEQRGSGNWFSRSVACFYVVLYPLFFLRLQPSNFILCFINIYILGKLYLYIELQISCMFFILDISKQTQWLISINLKKTCIREYITWHFVTRWLKQKLKWASKGEMPR